MFSTYFITQLRNCFFYLSTPNVGYTRQFVDAYHDWLWDSIISCPYIIYSLLLAGTHTNKCNGELHNALHFTSWKKIIVVSLQYYHHPESMQAQALLHHRMPSSDALAQLQNKSQVFFLLLLVVEQLISCGQSIDIEYFTVLHVWCVCVSRTKMHYKSNPTIVCVAHWTSSPQSNCSG